MLLPWRVTIWSKRLQEEDVERVLIVGIMDSFYHFSDNCKRFTFFLLEYPDVERVLMVSIIVPMN